MFCSTFLEQTLVVRDTVLAVDKAVGKNQLAIDPVVMKWAHFEELRVESAGTPCGHRGSSESRYNRESITHPAIVVAVCTDSSN